MTKERFGQLVFDLADSMGIPMKSVRADRLYSRFSWLTEGQFQVLMRAAEEECDRFPATKWFVDKVRDLGWRDTTVAPAELSGLVTVECPGSIQRSDGEGLPYVHWYCKAEGCDGDYIDTAPKRECPKCGATTPPDRGGADVRPCMGSFAVPQSKLDAAADRGEEWPCPNRDWGCRMRFSAAAIRSKARGGLVREDQWRS